MPNIQVRRPPHVDCSQLLIHYIRSSPHAWKTTKGSTVTGPGMKGGIHFMGWYLRVRLRSSDKVRIDLRECLGGTSEKGTYQPCSKE
jgi:hypothetical protein